MACENCKYWKPSYAPFLHRFVMECTKKERKGEPFGCRHFQRNAVRRKANDNS